MDPAEIARRVNNLKLTSSNRDEPIVIPSDLANFGKQKLESCLVGKVFSSKAVNRETFRVQMPRILQAEKTVNIEVIGDNLFILDFTSLIDRSHALLDGPWTFFKDLIIFKAPVGLQKPTDMVFDEIPIWVQCHNVPLAFMHASILSNLCERIGRVVEVDAREDGRCLGKYARIRVVLDITKPLKQGLWVQQEHSHDESCILLLYERLPNFCYLCGRLGHILRHCDSEAGQESESESELQFGHWMRASSVAGNHRKLQNDKSTSSVSSGSPSEPSVETAVGREAMVANNLPVMNISGSAYSWDNGSAYSWDKGEIDDNIASSLENHKVIKTREELVILEERSSSLSATDFKVGPNAITIGRKRMARGNSSKSFFL